MKKIIKKVAVLGSGTMGSQIACHFANIGLQVLLLDIVPDELTEEEKEKGGGEGRKGKKKEKKREEEKEGEKREGKEGKEREKRGECLYKNTENTEVGGEGVDGNVR
jgi:3-hydroxyacyl-CoA dehydrogenase